MATSSILGGALSPEEISGKDIHALGPSDNSDSGSDAIGAYSEDELASVEPSLEQTDADILPDPIQQLRRVDAGEENATPAENREALSDVEALVDDSGNLTLDEGDEGDVADRKA